MWPVQGNRRQRLPYRMRRWTHFFWFHTKKKRTPLKICLLLSCCLFIRPYAHSDEIANLFGLFCNFSAFFCYPYSLNTMLCPPPIFGDGWHAVVTTVVTTVTKSFNIHIFRIGENVSCINVFRAHEFYFLRTRWTTEHTKMGKKRKRGRSKHSSKNAGNQITFIMTARWKQ